MKLLTVSNPKTIKGEEFGYLTGILHLAPANLGGMEVCRWRTKGCTAGCLNTTGRGGIVARGADTNAIQEARKRRTALYRDSRGTFMTYLRADIRALGASARRHGLKPAVRLNGTSDLPWEASDIMHFMPWIQFYDYTKSPDRMHQFLSRQMPRNYHLTFSMAEATANRIAAKSVLDAGGNVAAVFAIKPREEMALEWNGYGIFDADKSDLRFLDPVAPRGQSGYIAGLRAKGRARKDTSGFVIQP